MKNTTISFVIVLMVLAIGGFVFANGKNGVTGNTISDNTQALGQAQKVVLSQNGYNYKDAVAKAGKPIEVYADNSVGGCLRSVAFNINGKRYSKYLRNSEDVLQLPALSKGIYAFSCSMGMGFGKLVVE